MKLSQEDNDSNPSAGVSNGVVVGSPCVLQVSENGLAHKKVWMDLEGKKQKVSSSPNGTPSGLVWVGR